jgi:hypothetical protein
VFAEAKLIELLSGFPTVVPTAVLIFCSAWWIVSLLVSGVDTDTDAMARGRGPAGRRGVGRGGRRRQRAGKAGRGGRFRRGLRMDVLPLSMAVTVLSFGTWAVSLIGSLVLDRADLSGVAFAAAGTGLLAVSVLAGLGLLSVFAIPAEKVFVTHTAPARGDAVGATCKIRSIKNGHGDARMLTGPTVGAIVSIELAPGVTLAPGDEALVVSYDDSDSRFIVVELDELLRG